MDFIIRLKKISINVVLRKSDMHIYPRHQIKTAMKILNTIPIT